MLPPSSIAYAEVGDVLQDDAGQPIPDGWHLLDGSTLLSSDWPDYVAALRIRSREFTLPAPQRDTEGRQWIVRLR